MPPENAHKVMKMPPEMVESLAANSATMAVGISFKRLVMERGTE